MKKHTRHRGKRKAGSGYNAELRDRSEPKGILLLIARLQTVVAR